MPRRTHLGPLAPLAALAAVLCLTLVACGDDQPAAGASSAPAAAGGAFPVSIEGALGTATIEEAPGRVVALGIPDADVALALGVQPVGIADMWVPGGLTPWSAAAVRGAAPTILPVADGIQVEKIAALRPDLILAIGDSRVDQDAYARLSRIAPTVSYVTAPGEDGWQTDAARIGAALGREDQARAMVDEVEALIARTAADHPELDGATFTFSNNYQAGDLVTLLESSGSTALFRELGLRLSPSVADLPEQDGNAVLSREQLGLLDADAIVMLHGSPALRETVEGSRIFQGLEAVERDAYVTVDLNTAIALRTPSVLSIPYALDQVVPPLAAALAGR